MFGKRIYPSYWRYLIKGRVENPDLSQIYLTAMPDPGAGIGHQMTNWISGYCWARTFNMKFAHLPFSTTEWDEFLGLGKDEVKVADLEQKGWRVRRIPLFFERDLQSMELVKNIISSYSGKKIVIKCEQNQGYINLYDLMDLLKAKFYAVHPRNDDRITYEPTNFNIAIHVRRGDIMANPSNANLTKRILSNSYYESVLRQVVERFAKLQDKPIYIFFFSQGQPDDYPEFLQFENIHWCLDMGAQDSFLHMVFADLLITSRSSFSYKPALMNNGIKVCPKEFWHCYPQTDDWIMCDNEGNVLWHDNDRC